MTTAEPELSSRIWTVPNVLSFLRLVGVPAFVWLILSEWDKTALVVLMVAGFTDYLDGKIARKFDMQSRLGAILDPMADRLYIVATIVCLAMRGILPMWVVLALVLREVFILTMAPTVRRHNLPLPPVHFIGKAATFNLLYAFPLLLLAEIEGAAGDLARPTAWAFVLWGVCLYWLAGLLYAVQVREMLKVVRARAV
ncbi:MULTISPECIES: CDP-alcohol phosphatidyltransferase family protein [Dermacoccus]|uniref:CDP-alcohol phosphatidyltransferase family protein n=2 Tax=Dermacoccus TaxID=57495 RepID=A0A417Z6B4_9MICO|nr:MULTISPECIES: CDP-alcohol phosphatidyltransferase family protein [Dermacoccus]MBZ4496404.1 CDP-alcohol phosphatidyltransferase family protein [Dermacoccus sp. Tok2021]MBE7371714.1 CDP-alcohol phosphatidyltransferase family protein [Dermacoccus barathri]MCT1986588.1 CDP-alcohol phosphatidyltransferase family protein [Dermacoccus abyssi]QEH93172.1 CDP-alcohol phosphatidyltransferase family protein [Dermacoccus abyssi]QNK52182.1 CDP-alcohol phosphatidyltransferase family protein [Dermacoccus s